MEKSSNHSTMEKDIPKQYQNNVRESGKEGFQPASPAFFLEPTGSRNTNVRHPNLSMPEVKPVLNFSIQTGEEFALEFMRDRVNHKKPLFPITLSDPSHTAGFVELKGVLGTGHTGSAGGSDIQMLSAAEKGPYRGETTNMSLYEERSNYNLVHSAPQRSADYECRELGHGFTSSMASDSSSIKIKVLCSFGGKILPRPSDGKLRYAGGDTHILRISRDISWQELKQKTLAIYDQPHVIKYQLPGEDLDALVSVSCDEDLRNMMEEWNEFDDRGGSQKLRMFLCSMSDLEDAQFGLESMEGESEIQYVVAINCMDFGSKKNSIHGFANSSGNNLSELDGSNIDRDTNRATASVGVSTSPLTSTYYSAQPILQDSSSSYETHPEFYHSQMLDLKEIQKFFPHYHHDSIKNSPSEEILHSTSLPDLINQQGGLTERQSHSSFQVSNSQVLIKEVKLKPDSSPRHEIDIEKTHRVEMVADPVDVEVSAAAQGSFHSLPSKHEGKHPESKILPSSVDAINPVQVPKSCDDDQCSTSSSTFGLGCADSVSNLIDFSYVEPSVPPQRVYYSERLPRNQAELMSRFSKSDDSLGSQFLTSHSHSEQRSIQESAEKLSQSSLALHSEHPRLSAEPLFIDPQHVNDEPAQLQKNNEVSDSVSHMNKTRSDSEDVFHSASKLAVPDYVHDKDSGNRDTVLKTDGSYTADNHKKLPDEEIGESRSGNPVASQVTSHLNHKNYVSDQPGPHLDDITATKPADISIDINDRFPHDFLSEIFSRRIVMEDRAGGIPVHRDGVGMSVIMENHEPKRWSYFQKLAQEEFVQKDVSLIDQDLLVTPFLIPKVKEGNQNSHNVTPLTTEGVSMGHKYSNLSFGEDGNQKHLPGTVAADSTILSGFEHSHVKGSESLQFGAMMDNLKFPDSGYEGGKLDNRNIGLPPVGPSLVDFDVDTLQVIKNEDLEELRELGSGTFGTVYHGKWRGSDVAIKRLKKICFTGRSSEQERLLYYFHSQTNEFWREAEILSKLHHPNVVAFYGVVQDGPGGTLATVTEYMVDGSLRQVLLKKERHLDRRKRLIIAMDAAFGMEYLHSKNIVHFDLKCDNLLVNLKDPQRPICKVGDFGLSKIKRNTLVSGGVRGTLPWMAPELLNGSSNKVSEKVDVFSFGIVLWEILTGEEPYANMHYGAIIGGIVNNTLRPSIPSFCDMDWKRLMEQCWAPNPAVRPSFTEIAGRLRIMSTAASQGKGHGHKVPK
ncbi:uncharacterized protein LOC126673045 isoform X2 [Mercurialis annua]|uniref:uncharacterized protein LOC126673045 isoform X2 n=1 Tax=Mercurialis annua TaxID=3986 RepID=UPI0021600DEB|nr:uncharacterized protein LOC126673045 isoform X2 [Mercurialis annua]